MVFKMRIINVKVFCRLCCILDKQSSMINVSRSLTNVSVIGYMWPFSTCMCVCQRVSNNSIQLDKSNDPW